MLAHSLRRRPTIKIALGFESTIRTTALTQYWAYITDIVPMLVQCTSRVFIHVISGNDVTQLNRPGLTLTNV